MILSIIRTAFISLRRDRFALMLSFVLPVGFFSIFASIFGGARESTPRVTLIVVDQDHSPASTELLDALERQSSLTMLQRPPDQAGVRQPDYTATNAEAAVKAGNAPVALVIPSGFGQHPVSFGPNETGATLLLLNDSSDMIAPQVVNGLLQEAVMSAMPESMAEQGVKITGEYLGGLTPEQSRRMQQSLAAMRQSRARNAEKPAASSTASPENNMSRGIISVQNRAVVGANKPNPMVSFYAAAFGVMFLLFTASNSSGVLLDESESGTLDRVLSTHVTMTTLLAGKLSYNVLLAFTQLTVMFLFASAVFHVDLIHHLPGFLLMGISTAFAVSAFGMLLASFCRSRAQLGPLSTLVIMTMSAIGGSMYPRYFMPAAMQQAGLFTINAWAIDGFTKVFWRDQPVTALGPQVGVLLTVGLALFLVARRIARRWEAI